MYCIDPQSDEPIFLIDAQIGCDKENPTDRYIDGNEFARELLYMDGEGKKRIQVWINSPGGLVTEGMAIYGAMLQTKTKVDTLCYGIAYSIAGVLFQAGRKRTMMDYATLMYHEAYIPDSEPDKGLNAINQAITTMISARSWKDAESVKSMMKKTSYITASEAKDADLCDEVQNSDELNKPRKTAMEAEARWMFANEYVNKILPTNKKEPQMNKAEICALLNLDATVSDDFAMNALKTHFAQNKSKNGRIVINEEEEMAAKAKVEKLEKECKDAKDALDALNLSVEKTKKEAAEAKEKSDAENKKIAAKKKIVDAVNARGISFSDKAIENYCAMAGSSDDALNMVIETIDAIPTTKKAPSFMASAKPKDGEAGFELGKDGGVVDTSKMVSAMNRMAFNAAKTRFSGKAV